MLVNFQVGYVDLDACRRWITKIANQDWGTTWSSQVEREDELKVNLINQAHKP